MKKLLFTLLILSSFHAFAQEAETKTDTNVVIAPIFLPDEVTVKSGDTKIIPLPRYTFIDRVSLEIKTSLLCGKDAVKISFDGENTKNLNFESGLSGYRTKIIVANTYARNVEVYNSSSCKVKIKEIQVLPRRYSMRRTGYGPMNLPSTEASAQVSFLLEAFLYLDSLVADADRVAYISPAKKNLGKALSILNTTPETSQASLAAIKEVITYLNNCRPFLDKLLTVESTFEVSTEIDSVKVTLERMVR